MKAKRNIICGFILSLLIANSANAETTPEQAAKPGPLMMNPIVVTLSLIHIWQLSEPVLHAFEQRFERGNLRRQVCAESPGDGVVRRVRYQAEKDRNGNIF